ncbi:nuclear transport factor 2 family protein [Deinococcus roseus]|uniref:SnoaL-like domain-containing protein n=1 Tax=Deinococcus roseus TaxID=392414 RepID=A0ABQ2CXZ2_9DEIO|nr:nuclear transport factor 2 family protein [Deinococcus roseus]GGJ27219.1 hypothetical protein GCM10008938_11670 [Deinococcus roseus]
MKKHLALTLLALTTSISHAQSFQSIRKGLDLYAQIWAENDPAKRAVLMKEGLTEDFHFMNNRTQSVGHSGFEDFVVSMKSSFPGLVVVFGPLAQHHNVARVAWQLRRPDQSLLAEGFDVLGFDESGKIKSLTGFVGPFNTEIPE